MSTRSNIGIMNEDGSVDVVYCHWDGYPEGVGACLVECHNSESDARKIIELGNLSSLSERLEPNADEVHTFEHPIKDVSVFYGRDRGEGSVEARHYPDIKNWLTHLRDSWIEYVYLFKENKWHCYSDWDSLQLKGEKFLYENDLDKENVRILFPILSTEDIKALENFLDYNNIDYEYL